jgi:hypothetical protein
VFPHVPDYSGIDGSEVDGVSSGNQVCNIKDALLPLHDKVA